jgi:hypothetical protein
MRVAWGRSGLGVRPVGSNAEGQATARGDAAGARRGAPGRWSADDVAAGLLSLGLALFDHVLLKNFE